MRGSAGGRGMARGRGLSRRELLGGVALGLLASAAASGCEADAPPAPRVPPPEEIAREAAVARERAVLASYDAMIAALPDRAAALQPLRSHHVAHVEALRTRPEPSPTGSAATPTGSPTPAAAPSRRDLIAAERGLAAAHVGALAGSTPQLALLLGSAAASARAAAVALEVGLS